ncbi:Hermansky-Pudlak syndrome 6 protein [Clarias magur]|uniref:Hermansky-Pudlak syndrome 6 protein n=1 Tax=Clarias magur TaxID=1594786 RepID=A0A8J4XK48_CLAMG|nr:Hermansky-Pudlak syndrome 6 protein [Clarias magur]
MTRHVLEQVTDFGDFTQGKELKDFLKQCYTRNSSKCCLSNIRISPDGRHVHIIQRAPRTGLMTHDRYPRAHLLQCQEHLDLVLTRNVSIVDLLYFKQNEPEDGVLLLGIIFENGKAELWKFSERKSGWSLIQTVDLCLNPRAKVVSVCISQNFIVWCEERPPSESPSVSSVDRSNFTCCICKRTFDVDERGISLGGI